MSKELRPQDVKMVKDKVKGSFEIHGDTFKDLLDGQIQLMIGWRVNKDAGHEGLLFPEDPDKHDSRTLIHKQRACEIYKGKIFLANSVWETHENIRERGEIPAKEYRVSAEMFFLTNLPEVPIIRLDSRLSREEIKILNESCVLLDPYYKIVK